MISLNTPFKITRKISLKGLYISMTYSCKFSNFSDYDRNSEIYIYRKMPSSQLAMR